MALGNIQGCFDPKRIINPYTKEVMYVECRQCPACRNRYARKWQERVEKECTFHRYSMFVTLTYSNDNLPRFQMVWNDAIDNYQMLSNRECDSDKELPEEFIGVSHKMSHDNSDGVPYVCRYDVVTFFKRFRSNIDYSFKINNINENKKIRYFLCSEYSPRGLRPHYHAIVWFDSEYIAKQFGEILSKSWTHGIVDYSIVNSSAPDYVAKYVACNTNLPEVLQLKPTRTFHLQSKKPCIGYNESDKAELFQNVINGTYGHYEPDATIKSPVYVQPPRSLEMRYFPKCRGWRTISYFEKLRIYSFAFDYERLTGNSVSSSVLHEKYESVTDIHATLACYHFCMEYHSTPELYLMYIDKYYSNKELYNLKQQYTYQMTYVNDLHQPLYHLMDFDLTFYERIPANKSGVSPALRSYLSTFGIDANSLYRKGRLDACSLDALKQKSSTFYYTNINLQQKIANDSNKSRVLNEQLDYNIFNSI